MAKKKKIPPRPSMPMSEYHDPSPRERVNYQLDDLARTMAQAHPRYKAIHEKIKTHLAKVADRHMTTGTQASKGHDAMYKDDEKDMKKKGKKGSMKKGSGAKAAKMPMKHKVAAMGKKKKKAEMA